MLFADYLLRWLNIVKMRVKITTYGSYEQLSSAKAMVEGISLPEADHFGSRWVRIEEND